MKAFRPLEVITDATVFASKDVQTVLREGMAAAEHHEFLILDSPPGAGATVAIEALKQVARRSSNILLVELTPSDVISTSSLWRVILSALGEKPAWRWDERDRQLQRILYTFAQQGKQVLVCVDDAIVMPRRCWQILKHMAGMHYEGMRYGPGVILVANLKSVTIRYKPREVILSADTLSLHGLMPEEVDRYIAHHATRDGVRFHPDFLAELASRLKNSFLEANGLSNMPGIINNQGKHVMRLRHRTGEPISTGPGTQPKRKPVGVSQKVGATT